MKQVIIIGASGMVGKLVLEQCVASDEVGKVTSISRHPLGIKHVKLIDILHKNFLDFSSLAPHFCNQDICFYCLGVYTGQVSPTEFEIITVDYTKAVADTLKQNSTNTIICFLSGKGADSKEKSRMLFARTKGMAENYLIRNFKQVHIFRPGYIYPVTPRKEPNVTYAIMRILYRPLSLVYPNIGIRSTHLAEKMFCIGMHGGTKVIYENEDIRSPAN